MLKRDIVLLILNIHMLTSHRESSPPQINDKLIEILFEEHYSMLCVYANKFLRNMEDAREIVQDIFVGLYEKKNTLTIHTSIKSHLYQSVKNASLNALKQKGNHAKHHEDILYLSSELTEDEDELFKDTESESEIYKAISELPEQCQRIFRMNRLEGLNNQEIADYLKISKRTVETQISNALKILRTKLSPLLAAMLILWALLGATQHITNSTCRLISHKNIKPDN